MSLLSNIFSLYNDNFAKITPANSLLSSSTIKSVVGRGGVFAVNLRTGVFTIVSKSRLATCGLTVDAQGNVVRSESKDPPVFTMVTKGGRQKLPDVFSEAILVLEECDLHVDMVFSDQPVTPAGRANLHWDDFVEEVRRLYQASYHEKMKPKKAYAAVRVERSAFLN